MSRSADVDPVTRLEQGDVLRINDHYEKFGVVSRLAPEPWAVSVETGLEVRVRALAEWSTTRFDAIIGVDGSEAFHVFDRDAGEVVVFARTQDRRGLYEESSQDVDAEDVAAYVRWVDDQRPWERETLPERFQDVLDAGGEDGD